MDTNYLFWKIVANVSGGHIHIYKEIGIWQKNGTAYERKAWWRQPLRYEICQLDESTESIPTRVHSPVHSQKLFVSDGRICFNGGFLKVYDPGLDIDGLADYSQSEAVEGSVTQVTGRKEQKVDITQQKQRAIRAIGSLRKGEDVCASIRVIQMFAELCENMESHLEELNRLIRAVALSSSFDPDDLFSNDAGDLSLDVDDDLFSGIDLEPKPGTDPLIRPSTVDLIEEARSMSVDRLVSVDPSVSKDTTLDSSCTDLKLALDVVRNYSSTRYNAWLEEALTIIDECELLVSNPDFQTSYYRGENIRLEVEFESDNDSTISPLFYYPQGEIELESDRDPTISPLFYYPQGERNPEGTGKASFGVISLTEKVDSDGNRTQRKAVATASNKKVFSNKQYAITGTGHHTLIFFEDRDLFGENKELDKEKRTAYFEILADAIPIYRADEPEVMAHWFDFLPKEFYIGYSPEDKTVFMGSIERVMFDPNASYPNGT